MKLNKIAEEIEELDINVEPDRLREAIFLIAKNLYKLNDDDAQLVVEKIIKEI